MTLLWYDLETFGRNPQYDRISQFAAIRTDDEFNPVEDPVVLYGKISPDYLPDPQACLLTDITPQEANSKGLKESDLVRAVDKYFSRPGTCALGYNSIQFDDEFIRNLYYRNFFDPYLREWHQGNSRWDILTLVRATRDLRPEGIEWPHREDGKPSLKLEHLCAANNLVLEHAHDALSDVQSTIALAKLIYEKHPKLFQWAYQHRTKAEIRPLIDLENRTPLVHTSGIYQSEKGCTTLLSPLATDPRGRFRNIIRCFDLRFDPEPLLSLPPEEIRRRMSLSRVELELEGIDPIPLQGIAVNKCPFLAPMSVLSESTAQRLGIDMKLAMERWEILKTHTDLIGKLREVFHEIPEKKKSEGDPDFQIYSGFFPNEDKIILEEIRETEASELKTLSVLPRDPRIPEMLRRYVGRNFPETLSPEEFQRWKSFCASRLLFSPVPEVSDFGEYRKRLASWKESNELEAEKKPIVKALEEYGDFLEQEILSYRETNIRRESVGEPPTQNNLKLF